MGNQQPSVNRFSGQRENDEPLDLDAVYNRTDQFGRRIRSEEELVKNSKSIASDPAHLVTHIVDDDEDDVVLVSDSSDSTALLIEDLPSFTTEQDIMKMFSDFTLLHIVLARKPKHFHAYVKFLSKEDAAIALKVKYNHRIGYKQVFVSECSDQAYEQAKSEFSIDPIPIAQMPQENQVDEVKTQINENIKNDGINFSKIQLFQKQFNEPIQSVDVPFGTDKPIPEAMNTNFGMAPPPIVDAAPSKFVANNSDPRRRKQLEQQDHQQQQPEFGNQFQNQPPFGNQFQNQPPFGNQFQNQPPFGESHSNNRFGESHQNNRFVESHPNNMFNESQNNSRFGEPHQNSGFRDSQPNRDFSGPPPFSSFQEMGNNHNQSSPFNRQGPNQGSNNNMNNRNMNMQPQRPADPRQRKNPFLQPMQQQQEDPQQFETNEPVGTPFLFLSNIDFRSSVEEIRAWFAEISVYPKEVYRFVNFRGQPNGKCVFLCNSPQEAILGLAKNKLQFRSRMAHINLMPVAEAAEALATLGVNINPNDFSGGSMGNQPNEDNSQMGQNMFNKKPEPETVKKVPNHKNPFMRKPVLDPIDDDVGTNDGPHNQEVPNEDVNENANEDVNENVNEDGNEENEVEEEQEEVNDNGDENADGDFENTEFVENDDGNNGQEDEQDDNNGMQNDFGNNGPPFNRNMMNNRHPNHHFNHGGNHMMMNMHNNHPHPSQRNTNGCVVALRNVPFQANAIDIMRFFHNFQLCADDIIRRYRDDGSPTGDARVCFASPMDAMAAVDQCQNGRIMNRIVQMRLFS